MTLASLPGSSYGSSPRTLLIAMNTRCGFCAESVPFYNRLTASRQANSQSVRIVALFPDSVDEVRRYVEQKQLGVETIAAVDLSKFNVSGTPTLILIDSSGKVLDFWLGKLTTDTEQQVIQRIST